MEELVRAWLEEHALAERLTDLERAEVYTLVTTDQDAEKTASEDGLSKETIRARRKRIYKKLNLVGREGLLREVLRFACARLSSLQSNSSPLP